MTRPSKSSLASGGDYGVESGWVVTVVFAIVVVFQAWMLYRSRRAISESPAA